MSGHSLQLALVPFIFFNHALEANKRAEKERKQDDKTEV